MAKFEFDWENAEIELGRISDLLGIYVEFMGTECRNENISACEAIVFAKRVCEYNSLVEVAQEMIDAMRETIRTAVSEFFAEAKKEAMV